MVPGISPLPTAFECEYIIIIITPGRLHVLCTVLFHYASHSTLTFDPPQTRMRTVTGLQCVVMMS